MTVRDDSQNESARSKTALDKNAQDDKAPVFTQGRTLRHTLVMTATGSIGLVAIFFVDFLSLLYVSWLQDPAKTAGVGFATQVLFLAMSVNIGLAIASTATVAHALGRRRRGQARDLAGAGLAFTALIALAVSLPLWIWREPILHAFGARAGAQAVGASFLAIVMPSNVLMALGMGLQGLLRACGDARRAMFATLSFAILTAALDPLLIFYFQLGTDGAAWATLCARGMFVGFGLWGAVYAHDIVASPSLRALAAELRPFASVAGPVILTNIASPVASVWAMRIIAGFGEEAAASSAIIDRVSPVAFGVLFAMTGAIGPIIAQNYGAGLFTRVRDVLIECFVIAGIYVVCVWAILHFAGPSIADLFHAKGRTRELFLFFCDWGAAVWIFLGCLFVANTAFNNLNYAFLSTLFNWGRTVLGVGPLALWGGAHYGPEGVMMGVTAGAAIFGIGAAIAAFAAVGRLARENSDARHDARHDRGDAPSDAK